ncbi:MAG: hypothetical protein JNL42_09390 [Anaerolineae bacterium]|nr:hypothetical protein [Anaerolineae bacterium]
MRAFWVLLTLCFGMIASAAGQSDSDLILGTGSDILFPQGVRIGVGVAATAADIAQAQLIITVQDQPARTIEVEVASAALVYTEPEARLRTIWTFADDSAPTWGDLVGYRWEIRLVNGVEASAEGEFLFSDPRQEWETVSDAEGRFQVVMPQRILRSGVSIDPLYALMSANTGTRPRLDWILYPPDLAPGCQSMLEEDGDIRRFASTAANDLQIDCQADAVRWVTRGWSVHQIDDVMATEAFISRLLVDEFYSSAWREKAVPEWFRFALSQIYSPGSEAVLLSEARRTARTGSILTMDAMIEAQESAVWQAQSYGMVAWLIDQIGVLGVFRLANVIAAAVDFATAYEQATGQPLEALIPNYGQWIFSREAEIAFSVSPYELPTAVPTMTLTPSPTRSPTPSLPPTASATATPEVIPSRTSAPTATRRAAQPLSTLTVTPRPPGSLQTPTPVPIPRAPSLLDQPNVRSVTLGVLVLLLVTLTLLLIRSGRRR